ncbi:MAG: VWA domain-containing protein, partial [Planctomycetota bacterium]|nr:VWA domain-containing protein [Planctomycetota bacterium]
MRRPSAHRPFGGLPCLSWAGGLLACALFAGLLQAQDQPQVQLPGGGSAVLGPDDTLELVIRSGRADLADDAPEVRAWLLASGQPAPAAGQTPNGRALAVASAARPGDWLVHLRGLTPPDGQERAAWDLLLRWKTGAAEGEARLNGALSFRRGQPDVVLLLDGSLSMGRTDPKRLRVEAARAFASIARDSGGIGRVALVQFDDNVRTILPLTPLTESAAIAQALEQIGENGQTDIDGGVRRALDVLRGDAKLASGAIILLTDGKQEPGDYKDAHKLAQAAGVPVHAVALGRDADRALLKRIASETGGTFSEAGRDQDLLRLYAAIAGKIAGGRTILAAPLKAAAVHPFPIDGSCRTLAVSAAAPEGGELRLTGPGGEALASGNLPHPLLFRMEPARGTWSAAWTPAAASVARLEASAQTPLYPLFFRAGAGPADAVEIDPDDPRVALSLCEGARTLAPGEVSVRLETSDAQAFEAQLFDDGKHGDGAAGDGVYAGELPGLRDARLPADASGELVAVASGRRDGEAYRRETRARWQVHRSGVRGIWTGGEIDFGTAWSGSAASGLTAVRVRGQGGALACTFLPPNEGLDLRPHLQLAEAPAALSAGARGQVELRLHVPEGTPTGTYSGALKLTLAATDRDPASAAIIPWKIRVRAAELQVLPARLDLGDLLPGARETRAVRVATRGGTLTLAPATMKDAHPFLMRRDGRLALLPQDAPEARRALDVRVHQHALARLGEDPADLNLEIVVPERATAGRWVQTVELRDRFGEVLARLPVELRVRAQRLRL